MTKRKEPLPNRQSQEADEVLCRQEMAVQLHFEKTREEDRKTSHRNNQLLKPKSIYEPVKKAYGFME